MLCVFAGREWYLLHVRGMGVRLSWGWWGCGWVCGEGCMALAAGAATFCMCFRRTDQLCACGVRMQVWAVTHAPRA